MTIRGIVAGVTVEGETLVDYRARKAVEVDAAFPTAVGMPDRYAAAGGEAAGRCPIGDGFADRSSVRPVREEAARVRDE